MGRLVALLVIVSATGPIEARWPHPGLFGNAHHHAHPINAWRGSHRLRLR